MSIQVTCPSCKAAFKASETAAGKQARCPKCSGVIEIPAAGAAAAADEIVDAEEALSQSLSDDAADEASAGLTDPVGRKPCPMCGELIVSDAVKCRYCGEILDRSMAGVLGEAFDPRDPAWRSVHGGLATIYYSLVAIVIAVILMIVGGMIMAAMSGGARDDGLSPAMLGVFVVGGIVILGAAIGNLVGQIRCASVPKSSGARGYALGAVLLLITQFMLSMLGRALQIEAISAVGNLLSIVGYVLFVLFIRRTAAHLGNDNLKASASRFLIFAVVTFVVAIGIGVVAGIFGAPILLGVLGLVVIIIFLIWFIWYLRMITSLMKTIDQQTGR